MDSHDPVVTGFHSVPPAARLRMFWRIFGPAWTREEIDRQLDVLHRAGVGGVMTCFTYPVGLDDPARGIVNQRFLSPEFLETLRHASERARALGLNFAVCGGSGWPYGGPRVSLHDAAQRLRREVAPPLPDGTGFALPPLREGERYLATFPGQVFIVGPTYMGVKRASLGAEGYVLDHYSRAAARRYLDAVLAPMLEAVGEGGIQDVFCDSLEVYRGNWTHDFPARFRRRRGYDLIPRLPELFDDAAPARADLRFDFWRTAAELAEEQFARTVHDWCRERGVAFVLEPYGTPPMGFTAARYCDVPWGEQYEWKGFSFSRFTASAGHLTGKQVIGTEAWTWTGIPNRLADSFSDLKLCSDLHFLAGENELTGVDFPYSPRDVVAPGWLPYFGPAVNENNPQWLCFPELAAYVGRCQWLLQQGEPVADVAIYVPTEDSFAEAPTEQLLLDFQLRDRLVTGEATDEFGLAKAMRHRSALIEALIETGYNFDGIDFFAMNALARVRGGRLVAGSGRYAIVVLPNLTGIDLKAMERIARFCRQGGTVIATRRLPDRVYGVNQGDATARLGALLGDMFAAPPNGAHRYGKGRAILATDDEAAFRAALAQAAVGPDVQFAPPQREVGHVHRRLADRDLYFFVNTGSQPTRFTATVRVDRPAASLWDPMTGAITPIPVLPSTAGHATVAVELAARGSVFVCLDDLTPQPPSLQGKREPGRPQTIDLLSWRVTFDGPDAPPPHETRDLTSWTTWPGGRYFSGRATYTTTFTAPSVPVARATLRCERIHEVAVVHLNGERAGAIWMPPYELEVTSRLRPGENRLEITVANLPVNRVLGLPDADLGPLRAVYGERFPTPEEKQLMDEPAPSGLIGRVVLAIES